MDQLSWINNPLWLLVAIIFSLKHQSVPLPSSVTPLVRVAKVSGREAPCCRSCCEGPALALPPAGSCSQSHPRAAPGPLQACCGPALALPATDPPHLVRPAASCLTALASSNMFAPGERSKWGLCLPEYPLHQLPQPALPRVSITGLPPLSHGSPAPFLPPGVKSSLTFSRTPL